MAKRKPGNKVQLARVVKNAPAQTARHFPASRHKLSKSDVSPMMTVTVAPTINWTASESSANRLGPLLSNVLTQFGSGAAPAGMARMIMDMELKVEEPVLPLALSIPRLKAENGEGWKHYKERAVNALGPVMDWVKQNAGLECLPILSCCTMRARGLSGQIREALKHEGIKLIELDPVLRATLMDDAVKDIELPLFRVRHEGQNDGKGVRVAVLDSGIDTQHPWLNVVESVSTCGESTDIPGKHATHVAGSIASQDAVYCGVAPGVSLLNIKVLNASGFTQATFITKGIDEALDRGVHILSMSIGFNHLPSWSQDGNGWPCSDGDCQLCRAVNTAVQTENVIAIVAAGNEHNRAEFLRQNGWAHSFDTELSCPGQASEAISVGAITKETFLTAPFSSRGPTAYGTPKPDLAAPGVNITSALVAPRDSKGKVLSGSTRGDLSLTLSGTSMATPIVTGAVALIRQRRVLAGESLSPDSIRKELLINGFRHIPAPPNEVGAGRLNVAAL